MTIEGVGTRIGNSVGLGQYPSAGRSHERRSVNGGTNGSADAMRVEVSPEAKRRGATASVAANNSEAAASAAWFASTEGRDALDQLLARAKS